MNRPRLSVILRWIVAGLIGGGAVFLLARVVNHETNWGAIFNKSVLALFGMIVGAVLIAPEVVRLAVAPFSRLIDSVLLPDEKVVPPADLKLARFYGQSLRYDEACEEFERILQYHPDNADAHLEGIRAAALAGNERLAAKFYHHAQRIMRSPDARGLLEAVYTARHQPLADADAEAIEPGAGAEPVALPEISPEPEPEQK